MGMKAYIDTIDTLEMSEVNGSIVGLTRNIKVGGIESMSYAVLMTALTAVGIPTYGSTLDEEGFEGLILVERNPTLANDDKGTVDVRLVYKTALNNQELPPTNEQGLVYGKGRASVSQKTTNFYVPGGGGTQPAQAAQQITVSHTYPIDDPDFQGQTIVQGGEVNVYMPEGNFTFEAYINTFNPWVPTSKVLARVNKGIWLSQPELCWMCTEVTWEMAKPGRYKFGFEFQLNLDTWDPNVTFIDSRTNRPPPGLVPGVGYKEIPYHRRVNFNVVFGSLFEGYQTFG